MGEVRSAEWYSARYSDPMSRYHHEPERLPYIHAWRHILERVPPVSLVDVGCGPGHFLSMLKAVRPSLETVGLDFSPVAVEMANKRLGPGSAIVWDATKDPLPPAGAYVLTEFLEHIEDDVGVLRQIPEGAWVAITVPMRDDPGHVRWFPGVNDAKARYERLIDIEEYRQFTHWHLIIGRRAPLKDVVALIEETSEGQHVGVWHGDPRRVGVRDRWSWSCRCGSGSARKDMTLEEAREDHRRHVSGLP